LGFGKTLVCVDNVFPKPKVPRSMLYFGNISFDMVVEKTIDTFGAL
jgi:hypothetical protein